MAHNKGRGRAAKGPGLLAEGRVFDLLFRHSYVGVEVGGAKGAPEPKGPGRNERLLDAYAAELAELSAPAESQPDAMADGAP